MKFLRSCAERLVSHIFDARQINEYLLGSCVVSDAARFALLAYHSYEWSVFAFLSLVDDAS